MKQDVIPKALFCPKIDRLKDLQDLFLIEEADEGFLITLLWDVEDGVCELTVIGIHKTHHPGKGFEGGQTLIPCLC